nr:unnamed protein product [Ipomoea batatas]
MSRKGASPLPSEKSVIFSNETCKNQPTKPFMNSQFRASGLNLAKGGLVGGVGDWVVAQGQIMLWTSVQNVRLE